MRYRLTIDCDDQSNVTQVAYDLYDDQGERKCCWVGTPVDTPCDPYGGLTYLLARMDRPLVQGLLGLEPFPRGVTLGPYDDRV
jgi:hypothetical protein